MKCEENTGQLIYSRACAWMPMQCLAVPARSMQMMREKRGERRRAASSMSFCMDAGSVPKPGSAQQILGRSCKVARWGETQWAYHICRKTSKGKTYPFQSTSAAQQARGDHAELPGGVRNISSTGGNTIGQNIRGHKLGHANENTHSVHN
eukprot:592981-Pelagomonas_calceolata.AAC.8